jgi:hypothetical protein
LRTSRALALAAGLAAAGCQGPPGSPGADGQAGPSGFTGYEIVRLQELLPPASGRHFRLKCPDGKRVVSGGWSGIEREMVVWHAYAGKDEQTWYFASTGNPGPVTLNLAVICIDAAGKEAR